MLATTPANLGLGRRASGGARRLAAAAAAASRVKAAAVVRAAAELAPVNAHQRVAGDRA